MGWIAGLIRSKMPANLACHVDFRQATKEEIDAFEAKTLNRIIDSIVNIVALGNFYDFGKLYDCILRTSPEVASCSFPGYASYLTRNPKVMQAWLSLHRNDSLFKLSENDQATLKLIQQLYPSIQQEDVLLTCSAQMTPVYRKFIDKFFSSEMLKKYLPIIKSRLEESVKSWKEEEITLNTKVTQLTGDILANVILGISEPDEKLSQAFSQLPLWIGDLLNAITNRFHKEMITLLPTMLLLTPESKQETKNVLLEAIEIAKQPKPFKKNQPQPLVQVMMEKKTFSQEQIIGTVLSLLIAGHDNVTTSLTHAILKLAQDPDLQDKIRQENKDPLQSELIRGLLSEGLRVMCPVSSISRVVNTSSVLTVKENKGDTKQLIRIGERVNAVLAQAARDPDVYLEPDKFDYRRFKGPLEEFPVQSYLPFGHGPHRCPGWYLYYVISAYTLSHLARNYEISTEFEGEPKQKSVYVNNLKDTISIQLKLL